MFSKLLESIKSNKFLLFITSVLTIIVVYIVTRVLGISLTVVITAFFVSMYKAKDKTKHIAVLKIMSAIVVIGGALLFLLLINHEWPSH